MLPNFQGAVLDSVIQEDRSAFGSMMTYYIAFNLVQTCFGVCRRICFSIMGKRIGYKSRNVLFSAILRQDIAFFDGMSRVQQRSLTHHVCHQPDTGRCCGTGRGSSRRGWVRT